MNYVESIITVLCDNLSISADRKAQMGADTELLGALPELDSMAIVSLVAALEEEFGTMLDDDDINAEVFATVGSLAELVARRAAA